jgi:hypothetical protein
MQRAFLHSLSVAFFVGAAAFDLPADELYLRAALPESDGHLSCGFTSANLTSTGVDLTCSGAVEIPDAAIVDFLIGKVVKIQLDPDGVHCTGSGTDPRECTGQLTFVDGQFSIESPSSGNGGGRLNPIANHDRFEDIVVGGVQRFLDVLDNDLPDGNLLQVAEVEPTSTPSGGTAEPSADRLKVVYVPPASIPDSTVTDHFRYRAKDSHGGLSGWADVEVVITRDSGGNQGCHRTNGGDCFGQKENGHWYTLAEEQAGTVSGTLYIPSFDDFHTVIYDSPSTDLETYWGCGPDFAPAVRIGSDCDTRFSLKANRTYVMRLPVSNGNLRSSVVKIEPSLQNAHKEYLFSLATDPEGLDILKQAQGADPFCERSRPEFSATFSGAIVRGEQRGCLLLHASNLDPNFQMLYVKFKAVGASAVKNCDLDKKCRLYLRAW